MSWKLTKTAPFIFVWLWSTGFIGAKYGLPYIEPFFMLSVRFSIVLIIFFIAMQFFRANWLDRKSSLQQIFIGALIHGAYLAGIFFAIKEGVPAGLAAIIVGLQPIVTSIIGKFFLEQSLKPQQLIGLTLGFSGICLVILEKMNFQSEQGSLIGLFACTVSLLSISVGTILQKKMGAKVPLLTGSLYQYIGALLVVGLLTFNLESQHVTYTLQLYLAMAWLIIGLSIFAILLLLYMIREGEVAKVTSYFYLVPPVAVLQTWWLFDEKLGALAIFGGLLTVLGVVLVVKYQKQ